MPLRGKSNHGLVVLKKTNHPGSGSKIYQLIWVNMLITFELLIRVIIHKQEQKIRMKLPKKYFRDILY